MSPATSEAQNSFKATSASHSRTWGLVGNPNTGKTTLFNALTGYRRHVANYPGVTVDVARGRIRGTKHDITLLDLPGTYSLTALAPDEAVVIDALHGRLKGQASPDGVIAIVDASNLQRNLYLVSQLLDLDRPVVVALNMIDVAKSRALRIDHALLSQRLGVPVIPVQATRDASIRPLVHAVEAIEAANGRPVSARRPISSAGVAAADEVRARYAWVNEMLAGVVQRPAVPVRSWSDRIDAVLTHRVAGGVILLLVLFLVFQSIFRWALPLMELVESGVGWLGELAAAAIPEGATQSLVVDGLIGGVGGVLVFLPQILILFAVIAILEDCGYMARAAFMMDRLMRSIGLGGRAFIPLLSSFACAVPAIMGARVIGDRRERVLTILMAPFMSCSARLPVYVLLIAAFVPIDTSLGMWLPGLVMFAMYLVGVVVAVPIAWILKKTVLRGPAMPFLLELPSYKWPKLRSVWQRMHLAGRSFLARAGTVILVVNLIVWALGYFPRDPEVAAQVETAAAARGWDAERTATELEGEFLRRSYLGRMGAAIEPLVRPLGWDWRIGVAVLASFPAREVVVGTLATIFDLGEQDEQSESLRDALHGAAWPDGRPLFTLPVALSLMVFFALCAQCTSTLVVMGRETRSWGWPIASFLGMTLIAYVAAWGTAAGARALGW